MMMFQRNTAFALLFVFIAGFLSTEVQSQTTVGPVITEEQMPEPRDPRYRPPFLPPFFDRDYEPGEAALLSPGEVDIESLLPEDVLQTDREPTRYDEADYDDNLQYFGDRYALERTMLRQYGIEDFRYPPGQTPYQETAARRFQIVYFLSLPFTIGLSYGLFYAAHRSEGKTGGFNNAQTVGFIGSGLLLSGIIGYNDYRNYRSVQQEAEDQISMQPVSPNFEMRYTFTF